VQPGLESVRILDATDIQPGGDERVLDRVVSELDISQDEPGRRMQSVRR